ncbi:MAG TPA: 23S rRNA (pseudouridine(1915)-N(3))-methyltransferase RlmH [Terriglobales bacterium]|nr:23S rRNA (pseudouridine(1915)-N(3))-methyltransferase RlmH [Terriglobales bacterium]
MKLRVAWIAPKSRSKEPAYDALTREYIARIAKYQAIETSDLPSEAALLKLLERSSGRTAPALVLLDSRGKQMSSEELAAYLESQQSADVQQLLFAIGPADGFTDEARSRASKLISLGKMTFPHELARVVLLEQLYRAFTILRKHPYHCGH